MKQVKITLLFLILNFGGLGLGSFLMNNGPLSVWYSNLDKAPWTPPGIVFGIAWTLIMICFSIYLGKLFLKSNTSKNKFLFLFQFILNVSWNFVFFNQHQVFLGFINIILLTVFIFLYFFKFSTATKNYKFLLLPYMIWLCIATSLNFYILIHN
ncbi:TspO/MBR family protein [uncultured Polaribacter sp.]|uniref:TspO/MBR family protein n=1 Tax=uncultured Polaribacter sp. TaxID=174711 RepID=UPI00260470D2|nr:TspO/MBR family protein [uncultured Polaribacter sp.]